MNKEDDILDRSYVENLSKEEQFVFLEKELDLNNQVDDSKFEKELGDYWDELCRVHPKRMLDAKGVTQDIRLSALFFMLNRILEDKIQIIEKKKIFIRNDDLGWIHLERINISKLKQLILKCSDGFGISVSMRKELISMIESSITRDFKSSNNIIQLKNGYFDGGRYYEGIYNTEIPKFFIPHEYNPTYCNIDDIPEFTDFIKHLSSNNEEVFEFILDTMASVFIQSDMFRKKNPYLLRFYGSTGENGKSTFIDLCKRIFYSSDGSVYEVDFADLVKDKNYERTSAFNSLMLVDADMKSNYIDKDVANLIKKLTTSDSLTTRQIYGKANSTKFLGVIMMMSNHAFKSEIKDGGLNRRVVEITINEKLKKIQKWFNELFSDEKVDIIRNFLIKRAIKLNETSVIDLPDILKKHQEEIMKGNNNVLEFIEDFGKDNFENCSVKFIFDKYNLWCESNGEIALKNTNFNSTIESELRLKREARRVTQISDKDEECRDLGYLEDDKRRIKCWVK